MPGCGAELLGLTLALAGRVEDEAPEAEGHRRVRRMCRRGWQGWRGARISPTPAWSSAWWRA